MGHLEQSLALHGQARNSSGQAEALNGLGEALLAMSQAGEASARHAAALALAIQCGDRGEEARARSGLARACQAARDNGQARNHKRAGSSRHTAGMVSVIGEDDSDAFVTNTCDTLS